MKTVLVGIVLAGLIPASGSAATLTTRPAAQGSTIVRKITQIIIDKLGVETDQVVRSANFVSDLGADSLAVVELRMEFEKEFDIKITDDEAEKMVTVGDAINLVYAKSGQ